MDIYISKCHRNQENLDFFGFGGECQKVGEDVVGALVGLFELAVVRRVRSFFTGSVSIITLLLGTMVSAQKSAPGFEWLEKEGERHRQCRESSCAVTTSCPNEPLGALPQTVRCWSGGIY